MSVVFFMGAGFSAPLGLPTMRSFFQFAQSSPLLDSKEKEFLDGVRRFANEGVRLVKISVNNMEDILSFLAMAEQLATVPVDIKAVVGDGESTYEYLQRILRKIYGPITFQQVAKCHEKFSRLIGVKDGKLTREVSFLTTNYDMSIETMLMHLKFRAQLAGDWTSTSGRLLSEENSYSLYDVKSLTLLCKLHGSVNWQQWEHQGLRVEQRIERHVDTKYSMPVACDPRNVMSVSSLPIIVAPTLFKHQTDCRLIPVWVAAAEKLKMAEKIVFVGFSFPESDTYMRYFLGAALVKNVRLDCIEVIDPDAVSICDRLRSKGDHGSHFVELLRPNPGPWQTPRRWPLE